MALWGAVQSRPAEPVVTLRPKDSESLCRMVFSAARLLRLDGRAPDGYF
jgi:hypothetical protein